MAGEPPLIASSAELETLGVEDELRPSCVAGRYEVKRSLGRGASKQVFLAHDIRLDREVALSLVRTASDRGGLSPRILQEIRTTARLDEHPHIVTVYDVIEENGATWIVSQLVRGGSVADRLEANPQGLPVPDAVRIAREVADALHFAHENGVIHRDVKPSNVLLAAPDDTALLADFGVAFLPDHPRLTVSGAPVGTAAYMSPEQARGETVDRRSDLYGLGAMLFELICGRPPFAGDTVAALVTKHLYEPAPNPCLVNPAVPEALGRLILQLLNKRPDARPPSGLAVCAALDALGASASSAVQPAEPSPQALPAPLITDPLRPFVGRHASLHELRDAWDRAATGRPHLALLTGEPGIGKTRLASAFASGVHDAGAVVLYGRCDEDPLVSYQPFVEALRQLIASRPEVVTELDPDWSAEVGELAKLVPELRRHVTTGPATGSTPQSLERYQLFETILALLSPTARRERLLLVLDDMQWADEPTKLLLRHLMRAPLHGLMVLITRRPPNPDERDPIAKVTQDLKREAAGDRRLVTLTISGLDAEETYDLASSRSERPVDHEFSRLLQANTAGNPFFIEQILRGLHDSDLSASQPAAAALRSLGVPREVEEFIEYRLAAFSGDTVELLKQAAVCGPEFRLDVLAEFRGARAESLIERLSAPIAAGLVVEPRIGRYAFSHALVRETLYQRGLGKSERAQLHLRIGETLERMQPRGVNAPELALHFHAAREIGGAERAVKYALAAADAAAKALAYEEAAEYAREACDALECLGPSRDAERCRVLLSAGRLCWQAGDQRAAQREFQRAAVLARQLGDATQFARATLGYAGRSYDAEGIDPVLRDLFEEALATVPTTETSLRAKLLARYAEALHPVDGARAIELTDEALDILRVFPDDDALTTAVAARHMTLLHIDHHEERLEVGRKWVQLAEERRRESVGMALNWRAYDLLERGDSVDVAVARGVRERLGELAERLQQPLYWHFAASLDAKWLLMEGRFAEAEQKAREAYTHGTRAQGTHVALLFGGQRFALLRDQGKLRELPREAAPFLDTENPTLPGWRAVLMLARRADGQLERAGSELHDMVRDNFGAVPASDMFWLGTMCVLGECAAELGDTAVAPKLIEALEPYARFNAQLGLTAVIGPVHEFLGRLTAVLGDEPSTKRHSELALERARILGARPAEARVQCHYGEFLVSRGGQDARGRGRELLERSRATSRRLGMAGINARAVRALAGVEDAPRPRAFGGTPSARAR